jgi:hypothetical protein
MAMVVLGRPYCFRFMYFDTLERASRRAYIIFALVRLSFVLGTGVVDRWLGVCAQWRQVNGKRPATGIDRHWRFFSHGWMLFEYLNFFVDYDWFYPFGDQISNEQFLFYAIIISTGLLPLSFVFYDLFNTVPVLKTRFSEGPAIYPAWKSKNNTACLSALSLFAAGLFPDELFFVLWLSPAILIGLVLDKLGIWTPLRSIGKGNWRPTLVFALTYLAAGLCLECENYFSAARANGIATYSEQPAFWQYNLALYKPVPSFRNADPWFLWLHAVWHLLLVLVDCFC